MIKCEGGLRLQNNYKKHRSNLPLISIVTVVFNAKKALERTIQSISDQSYNNIELIVIDGGSTDGTVSILEKFNDKIDYWLSEKDKGIYHAMNKAITFARGDYIFFLGADDELLYDGLDNLMKKIKYKVIEPLIVFPVMINGKKVAKPNISFPVPIVHHQGALFNLKILKELFPFSTDYKIHADFDLMCRYISLYGIFYNQNPICNFYKGGVSTNGLNTVKSITELLSIYFKYNGKVFSNKWMMFIIRPLFYYMRNKLFR